MAKSNCTDKFTPAPIPMTDPLYYPGWVYDISVHEYKEGKRSESYMDPSSESMMELWRNEQRAKFPECSQSTLSSSVNWIIIIALIFIGYHLLKK